MALRYSEWSPTQFDTHGLGLEDRQMWLVCPVMKTRDSGPLEESNFDAALAILGGESETVEVHSFNHWACGHFEIILCHPDLEEKVDEIQSALEDYPVLDEEDYSRREWEEFERSWDDWGWRDFVKALSREFELNQPATDFLENIDRECLRDFYMELANEPYISEPSSGVSIRTDRTAKDCTRQQLAEFIRKERRFLLCQSLGLDESVPDGVLHDAWEEKHG